MDFIHRVSAYVFNDGISDKALKEHIIMGGGRQLNEAIKMEP
jgi:hypothetical protein